MGKDFSSQAGLRFLPEIGLSYPLDSTKTLSALLAVNSMATFSFLKNAATMDDHVSFYRCWFRYSSKRLELRAGLQKINFGQAMMFRPLMWFDQLDPRDPLQLTTGVWGLMGRYYFRNNANVWGWVLDGNENPKGWEYFSTEKNKPEFGGRFQSPFLSGEAGLSGHYRQVSLNSRMPDSLVSGKVTYPESRLAMDVRWDKIIGFWVEYVVQYSEIPVQYNLFNFQHSLTLGADYTLGIGNGLNLVSEFFLISSGNEVLANTQHYEFAALSASYPVGLLDRVSAIIFYNITDNEWYRFVSYQRAYDKWSFYLMAFWNPEKFNLYQENETSGLFTGKGFQFMAAYNF